MSNRAPAPPAPAHVVVVDTDRLFRRFVTHALETQGMTVTAVDTLAAYLAQTSAARPDLVIVGGDVEGGFDGACRRLRNELPGVAIVASPERCSRLCEASVMAAGADAVVAKGRSAGPLVDAVARCLSPVS